MLKTEIQRRRLQNLTPLGAETGHDNARYMKPQQFKRLVENIRSDGTLTSAPLIGKVEGEELDYILSGNHRVAAAVKAGIEEADCIVILEPLAREQFIALQLSHNAIEGEDDPAILRKLYDELNLDLKEYSGISDEMFEMDDFNVKTMGGVSPMYVDLVFSFLSDDANCVAEFLKNAESWAKRGRPVLAAEYKDFDAFFDTVIRVKDFKGVTNSAVAMRLLVDLANERIDQLEKEKESDAA